MACWITRSVTVGMPSGRLPPVGFGISTPEQAAEVARFADGVIVGSAIVRRIGEAGSRAEALESATEFVRSLSLAVRGASD